MKTLVTGNSFHTAMIAALELLKVDFFNIYKPKSYALEYFKYINQESLRDSNQILDHFYELIQSDDYSKHNEEFQKDRLTAYKKLMYEIEPQWARLLFNESDLILENWIVIPFYYKDICLEFEYSSTNDGIFTGPTVLTGVNIAQDILVELSSVEMYHVKTKKGVLDRMQHVVSEVYNKKYHYSIHYEHYSSTYVDPGETINVLAGSLNNAMEIMQKRYDSPEDGILFSYEIESSTQMDFTKEDPISLNFGNTAASHRETLEK